jgi:hypothetical protein
VPSSLTPHPGDGARPPQRKDAQVGGERALRRPTAGVPALYVPPNPDKPLVAHRDLKFGTGPLREECWGMLPTRVARKLWELAGQPIAWWAQLSGTEIGRVDAHLLGSNGYALAEPRIDGQHRPVYAVCCYVLDPGSFRHVDTEYRPGPKDRLQDQGSDDGTRGGPPPVDGLGGFVLPGGRGNTVLSWLPPRVQRLLVEPFLSGQPPLRVGLHYEGTAQRLSNFSLVIAGARDLTAASGTRVVPVGHDESHAHWSLMCHHAVVVRRIGK